MKEAFLMGVLAMGANADDNDINVKQVLTPVEITQNGETRTVMQKKHYYSVTPNDTRAETAPQVTRHLSHPS